MSDASTDQPSGPAGGIPARLNSIAAIKALREGFTWLAKPPYSFTIVEDGSTKDHNGFEYALMLFRGTHCDVCVCWHPLQSEFGMAVSTDEQRGKTRWGVLATEYCLMLVDDLPYRGLYVKSLEELSMLCEVTSAALRRHAGLLDARCAEVSQSISDRVDAILAEQTD